MKSKNTDQIDDIREDPFEEYIRMGEPDKADKVSVHIAEILSDRSFTFSPAQYISIHRRLFQGVFSHAGKLRDYNITKNVTNDVFAKHAWYFRNSLVRANYQNVKNGVYED
ncbi:MAG: hypothetical protein IJP92_15940, partial [Lachnospiraceae bacterium]|nr:hypothetical protein [Lachnospiraceae bacterium]